MTRKLLLTILVVASVGAVTGFGTYSAFSSTATSSGNSMQAGTVSIGDDHTAAAMLNLANAKPGDRTTGCIRVTYTGSLPATVRMYANPSGTLAPYLKVTIERGSGGSYPGCTGFSPTGTTFSGTMNTLPASWAAASDDPLGTWNRNQAQSYRVDVQLDPNAPAAAQGGTAALSLTWEARNQ
jgi:hypothetical protein